MGLRVGSAVGQTSIADEISELIQRPNLEIHATLDPEYIQMEPQTSVDILVATPGRLMDHINMTKGFSLEHLRYLVICLLDQGFGIVQHAACLPKKIHVCQHTMA